MDGPLSNKGLNGAGPFIHNILDNKYIGKIFGDL